MPRPALGNRVLFEGDQHGVNLSKMPLGISARHKVESDGSARCPSAGPGTMNCSTVALPSDVRKHFLERNFGQRGGISLTLARRTMDVDLLARVRATQLYELNNPQLPDHLS